MSSMRNWMLGAAVLAGAASLGSIPAQAAQFGVYVGGPVGYGEGNPGPGYAWVAGYWSGGYWTPGRWNYVGYRDGDRYYHRDYVGRDFDHDRGRDWDRGRDRDRDRDRNWDRDRDRGRDRDHR